MKKIMNFLAMLLSALLLSSCNMPSWLTYTNTTYQFRFRYPPSSTIVTDTPTSTRIQLPITPGTNLTEKYLDVSADPGAIPCLSPYSDPYGPPPGKLVTGTQIINGISWVIESSSEGAAGSIYEWTAYSTSYGEGPCVNLTFVLHSHPTGLFPTPPPEFNKSNESLVFELIVSTFEWLIPAVPTPVATPTPTPVFTFTPTPVFTWTPTPIPFFYFVPKFNAYCRPGPDPIFGPIAIAMKDQFYPIDGRNQENTWLYIMINPQVGCWVPLEDGTPSADTEQVRVLNKVPTPTFTQVTFNCAQFGDPQSCGQHPECAWNRQVVPGVCKNK